MRVIGRYFAMGATLGSVSGLVALVLIWTWMTVHLGVFGFLIALMGCYQGYNSKGGAQGVGSATTLAVVSASILILAFDYVLTEMFFAR